MKLRNLQLSPSRFLHVKFSTNMAKRVGCYMAVWPFRQKGGISSQVVMVLVGLSVKGEEVVIYDCGP